MHIHRLDSVACEADGELALSCNLRNTDTWLIIGLAALLLPKLKLPHCRCSQPHANVLHISRITHVGHKLGNFSGSWSAPCECPRPVVASLQWAPDELICGDCLPLIVFKEFLVLASRGRAKVLGDQDSLPVQSICQWKVYFVVPGCTHCTTRTFKAVVACSRSKSNISRASKPA